MLSTMRALTLVKIHPALNSSWRDDALTRVHQHEERYDRIRRARLVGVAPKD
jgi:hypothetical protein